MITKWFKIVSMVTFVMLFCYLVHFYFLHKDNPIYVVITGGTFNVDNSNDVPAISIGGDMPKNFHGYFMNNRAYQHEFIQFSFS